MNKKQLEEFIESGADLEHARWSKWQKYLHSLCDIDGLTGDLTIPAYRVKHWERQINTEYKDLSEKEKESDRIEVRSYIPLLQDIFLSETSNDDEEKILNSEVTEDDYQFTEKGFGY